MHFVYANQQHGGRLRAGFTDNNLNIIRVPYLVSIEVCDCTAY